MEDVESPHLDLAAIERGRLERLQTSVLSITGPAAADAGDG